MRISTSAVRILLQQSCPIEPPAVHFDPPPLALALALYYPPAPAVSPFRRVHARLSAA